MAGLVDTHCHLADERLRADVDGALERAATAGVRVVVAVGAIGSIESDRMTVEIAERHEHVYASVGVHPHNADSCDGERIAQLRDLARSRKVVAIGESGLDFHYAHSPPQAQEAALRRHLELAAELALPVVIHCREAEGRLVEIVRDVGMPAAGGVIHSFTGDRRAADAFLELGFYVSFSGILTFKNAATLRDIAPRIPDDRVLVETDAPYLTPEPLRGRRNEPAFVRHTLAALANARGVEPDALSARVMANAARLFRFALP